MIVLLHYRGPELGTLLAQALDALARAAGFEDGWVGRSPDDPTLWVLGSQWRDAGALRHGLGSWEAKLALGPLQEWGTGGDQVVEVLIRHDGSGSTTATSDRAPDADRAAPRDARG